jgi:DNA invertase Pin-like site-specific DNA recombinase
VAAHSSAGLIFHIFGALAEFERDTQAGLQAARARGRKGGRPKRQPSAKQVAMAKALYGDKSNPDYAYASANLRSQ